MKKIGIVGAGAFGCSIALELEKKGFEVHLFEKDNDICQEATKKNHLRHHYGYHYPRSKKTALESINARKSFEKMFKECIIDGFPAYYAMVRKGSKTSKKDFLEFCDELGLKYEIVAPDPKIFNVVEIDFCIKTPEPAYDPLILKEIIKKYLKDTNVKISLSSEITNGKIMSNGKKRLTIRKNNKEYYEDFDIAIFAVYSNLGKINGWFDFPKKRYRYDLMELLDVELPIKKRFGAMIIDGDFSTFVPLTKLGNVRLGHVREVRIKTEISEGLDVSEWIKKTDISKSDKIMKESIKYFPILKEAKVLGSNYIVRIVRANVDSTDDRTSEITDYGNGVYSILAGKVISCVDIAKDLSEKIIDSLSY